MPWLHFKTDHALRRKENKVEFLEGRFLSFLHKKKAEHSLDLSLFIFCLLTVYFKPWNAELLSQNICMMIAQKPFCWKWISVTKISKYGQNEYLQALNASYTFQPLMGFWLYLMFTYNPCHITLGHPVLCPFPDKKNVLLPSQCFCCFFFCSRHSNSQNQTLRG